MPDGDGVMRAAGSGADGDGVVRAAGSGADGNGDGVVRAAGSGADGNGDGVVRADGAVPDVGCPAPGRSRPVWPRGVEGRRLVAREYRAARDEGADPVLAVMNATGHSRRRSLRLIAQARDAGLLAPRHARR
ncbi:DUF6214 family protein [Streptomyces sp. SID486]|uniref:DUF6214 family protein n=1 Tax=Streptomyces sp. SID486 TaxID=2690264 RepID=UPI0031F6816C